MTYNCDFRSPVNKELMQMAIAAESILLKKCGVVPQKLLFVSLHGSLWKVVEATMSVIGLEDSELLWDYALKYHTLQQPCGTVDSTGQDYESPGKSVDSPGARIARDHYFAGRESSPRLDWHQGPPRPRRTRSVRRPIARGFFSLAHGMRPHSSGRPLVRPLPEDYQKTVSDLNHFHQIGTHKSFVDS